MLIKELIVRHVGPQGALHERGIRLNVAQVPPGVAIRHDRDAHDDADVAVEPTGDNTVEPTGDNTVAPVAGDLLVVSAPVGPGLPERIDTDLPVGASVVLLFEVEVSQVPVDRVLAALAVAKLQVVEAAVVSDTATATVAVVAKRTDEPVVPQPSLASELEPGDHTGPSVLRRLLGQVALEGLVAPARERELRVQVAELQAQIGEVTAELEKMRVDRASKEAALLLDRDTARRDAKAARKDAKAARKDADAERKRMQSLRSSTSFKLASRLARASSIGRRIIRRPGSGKPTP